MKGAELDAGFMMFAPAGTPPETLARLNAEVAKLMALPEVQQRMIAIGVAPGGGSLEHAARTAKDDFARYGKIVREANIRASNN